MRMTKNMIKALSWKFRKYYGRFHMLIVNACSGLVLHREFCSHVFHFFWEKVFYFSYNSFRIGSGIFSKSWTGYLSSAINMLTNTSKIPPNSRGDIFQLNFNENGEKHGKRPLMKISKHFGCFHILTVKGCSETALFIEWSNQDLDSL